MDIWDDVKVLSLIKLYRSQEILWSHNMRNQNKIDKRAKRMEAICKIANELNTSVSEVERKIKNITSHYYREKKKVEESMDKANSIEEIYQSKWFAYNALSFLRSKNGLGQPEETKINPQNPRNNSAPTRLRMQRNDLRSHIAMEFLNIMRSVSHQEAAAADDEDTLFGQYIAGQLRNMDKVTKAVVRQQINNIIYEAEAGNQIIIKEEQ